MVDEANVTDGQGNTETTGQEGNTGEGNEGAAGQENLTGIGADAGAQDGGNAADDTQDSGIGKAPETDEEKFAKEYVGKPEEGYDFKDVELPEGMTFNEELTEGLKDLAGKYNMSQKGANDLMSMGVKLVQNATAAQMEAFTNQCIETNNKFFEALKADPEIGGSKLEETCKVADVAYKAFIQGIDADAHAIISQSGLLNNKAFVKMLYEIGGRMQDGKILSGGAGKKERTAEDFYPNMKKTN